MKDSAEFLRDLEKSRRDVEFFASRQRDRGVSIAVAEAATRPDASVRMQYADRGDMVVSMRVEHKVRALDFTCREDFPYDTVIIDEAYKVREKDSDPVLMYVIENRSLTHAAVVYGFTRKDWQIETIYDRRQGRECENYVVHKSLVRFCPTEQVLAVRGGETRERLTSAMDRV
jgi:hypothetical protein